MAVSAGPIIALLLVVAAAILLYCEARYEAKHPPRLRDKELRAERSVYDHERIRSMGGWR
jgi:hypothetical protein